MSDPLDEFGATKALARSEVARVRTAIPAIITAYDHATQRATVQIAIRHAYRDASGKVVQEQHLPIASRPVMFPMASGYALTFPLAVGDECLLLVAERSLDEYLDKPSSDATPQDLRRFDLRDSVVLPVAVAGPVPSSGRDGSALVVEGLSVLLGSSAASEFVALAQKTSTRLNTLITQVQAMVTVFNAHVHTGNLGAPTSPSAVPQVNPTSTTSSDFAATRVKAE